MEPLTPELPIYPSETDFTPQQLLKVDELIERAKRRAGPRKEISQLRKRIVEVYDEIIEAMEARLSILTN